MTIDLGNYQLLKIINLDLFRFYPDHTLLIPPHPSSKNLYLPFSLPPHPSTFLLNFSNNFFISFLSCYYSSYV